MTARGTLDLARIEALAADPEFDAPPISPAMAAGVLPVLAGVPNDPPDPEWDEAWARATAILEETMPSFDAGRSVYWDDIAELTEEMYLLMLERPIQPRIRA